MVRVLSINPLFPDPRAIERAVRVIQRGGLIVYPTDTVYGLGANALDPEAVRLVFAAKNRPPEQALPVAVRGTRMADELAVITRDVQRLIEAFWPGALTIILEKRTIVPDATTGGRRGVAIRMPDHQIPLQIMEKSGLPLIATSANIHGQPNSLTSEEAISQVGEKVDLVLDGGNASAQPSTVLDMTIRPPRVLRLGSITKEEISLVLGFDVS